MKSASSKFILILSLLAAFLNGCGGSPAEPHHSASDPSVGILGGSEVQESETVARFTIGLYDAKSGSRCTGSLIAEDTVLTAAHCVDPSSKELFILFDRHLYDNGKLNRAHMIKAESFVRHPQYDPTRTEGSDTYDLALIHFPERLPPGFEAVELSSDTQTVGQPGAPLIAAGFGVSNGLFGTGGGILRKAQLSFRRMHSTTEFETNQNTTGVCSGDSGGPLFQDFSRHLIQVGVASRVATKFLGCRDYAVYTRVDVYKDWIESTTAKLRSLRSF